MTPTQAILAAEADRYRAMIAGDVDALRAACDPKLRYVSSFGVAHTLESWLSQIESETWSYSRIEHPVDAIQIEGNLAIVHGRIQAYGEVNGVHTTFSIITLSVLLCGDDGHWRLRAFQETSAAA